MKSLSFLKSASRGATYVTAAALAALTVKVLILNRWPAPYSFLFEFGSLVDAVLASVVASYVFYLFVVHLKDVNDRKVLGPYIDRICRHVVSDCELQLVGIGNAADTKMELDDVSIDLITATFSKIPPYSWVPMMDLNGEANWVKYFNYFRNRTRENIVKVMAQLIYVDVRRVKLLAEIDDCSHFAVVDFLQGVQIRNTDLSAWAPNFHAYCLLCRDLKRELDGVRILT